MVATEKRQNDTQRSRTVKRRWGRRAFRRTARGFSLSIFSSLSRRIIVLNLAGLVVLVSGILYLNQFRAGLIDARVQSLLTQGEIIAGAIAASATVETDTITIDPDRLLQMQAGESIAPYEETLQSLEFPINPERVAPVLRRLISPTKTRARLYDRDGVLLLDSRHLYSRGQILRFDLAPPDNPGPTILERALQGVKLWLRRGEMPIYEELGGANGKGYPEVARALGGAAGSVVRVNEKGELIVSVAVPIQRFRAVVGSLLLSTQGGDIDAIITAERFAIMRVAAVAAAVTIVLSILLASTIAGPVRRLAAAAERVRRSVKAREEIPDFSGRTDEIGHLARALRDMTTALYSRIEAIESFAADVAHELKNPLTSLRSAVETLPLAKTEASRERLMGIIQHDVRRLDRLISDISDASRLDAELAREDAAPVDIARLLESVVAVARDVGQGKGPALDLVIDPEAERPLTIIGHDSRLGQVITNLIDNARSFSPPNGRVRVLAGRTDGQIEIAVEDDG
ncbi:MAG TPA: sensor histidine kinase, partial [Kaistiaceae bacterium]|nr:sensor histidine kinase [Kaistiaceae bacterium]